MRVRWLESAVCSLLAVSVLGACADNGVRLVGHRVTLSPVSDGRVVIVGRAGAIVGAGVTTLTLTVVRPPAPAALRVRHVGEDLLPVISTWVPVAPDGSFPATTIGTADRPLRPGDELMITPQAGLAQTGRTWAVPLN